MEQAIRILLPIFFDGLAEIYFTGYVYQNNKNAITIFITSYSTYGDICKRQKHKHRDKNAIYGKCGRSHTIHEYKHFKNFVSIDIMPTPEVKCLVLDGSIVNIRNNDCIFMLYDYNKMRDSQMINESADYFFKLHTLILSESGACREHLRDEIHSASPKWLGFSMFLSYIYNYYRLIKWLVISLRREKKVSVKQGNLILAIILDLILGYLLLQLLSYGKKDINTLLVDILEKLINLLHSLLKWIMGAPAGLKLNNAFNKMLGKYFSYHVQLWWLFLDVTGEKLDVILHIYHFVGYLGFTFQTAIISDMICIATFHSYCIYVYAARLFNLQISGLVALLRLFVGRKYNPLRGSIDSCEYTNQELFVGTVAFTILLLLLPTTTMYYIVFTLFRVFSLTVQYTLAKLINILQTLPLYVVPLWTVHSPKVAGNILLEVVNNAENSPLVLRVKLLKKSLYELVTYFKPPVEVLRQVEWTSLLSNIFVGKQLV